MSQVIDNVYYVKDLKHNLLSISQMCDKGNSVLSTSAYCKVTSLKIGNLVLKGQIYKNVCKAYKFLNKRTNCMEESVHVIFDEQKSVDRVSTQEEIEKIGMAPTTNTEGEPGTQDKSTKHEHLDTSRMLDEQGTTPDFCHIMKLLKNQNPLLLRILKQKNLVHLLKQNSESNRPAAESIKVLTIRIWDTN
ncbi:hypothetical protein HAX54_004083 [Datura stramonium]|uniref:Uncharacterized protein n=1 Tax=Datura stramonium TaxID=4076 RepID=A0ABS8T7H9_DATST|nr:hypothetical protein [Datura stramonium]